MKKVILWVIVGLALTSCRDESHWCAGPEVKKKIDLGEFKTIEVNGIFDILLAQDSVNYALVTCGKNNLDDVNIIHENDILRLSQRTFMNWTSSYQHTLIELHFTSVTHVKINYCVKMESVKTINYPEFSVEDNSLLSELKLNVKCDRFRLSISDENFGIYEVSGVTSQCIFHLNGSAHFKTGNLVSDSCHFIHSGNGDCFINAKSKINGKIIRNGKVYYKYYPMLSVQIENKEGRIYIIGG